MMFKVRALHEMLIHSSVRAPSLSSIVNFYVRWLIVHPFSSPLNNNYIYFRSVFIWFRGSCFFFISAIHFGDFFGLLCSLPVAFAALFTHLQNTVVSCDDEAPRLWPKEIHAKDLFPMRSRKANSIIKWPNERGIIHWFLAPGRKKAQKTTDQRQNKGQKVRELIHFLTFTHRMRSDLSMGLFSSVVFFPSSFSSSLGRNVAWIDTDIVDSKHALWQ